MVGSESCACTTASGQASMGDKCVPDTNVVKMCKNNANNCAAAVGGACTASGAC